MWKDISVKSILCVKWDVKLCSVTHFIFSYPSTIVNSFYAVCLMAFKLSLDFVIIVTEFKFTRTFST